MTILSDVKLGLRMFGWRGETPAMLAALVLGLGLTVAAYSLVHAVLIQQLPYAQPENLVRVWDGAEARGSAQLLTEADRAALQTSVSPFRGLAAFTPVDQTLRSTAGSATDVAGAMVSANAFDILGVRPLVGRTFQPGDDRLTAGIPIVVSERLVRAGLVTGKLDEIVEIDGIKHRLAGVMPSSFWFPNRQAMYWVLSNLDRTRSAEGVRTVAMPVIARLPQGTTALEAESQANAQVGRFANPQGPPKIRVESYAAVLTSSLRPSLVVLQGASGLLLLLVCLNVGWLFTARSRRLSTSFATMRALGASRGRLAATFFGAALPIALVAAAGAILVAWVVLRVGLTLDGNVFSTISDPGVTSHVAIVALVTAWLVTMMSAVPGTWLASRPTSDGIVSVRVSSRNGLFERSGMVVQMGFVLAIGAQALLFALVLHRVSKTNVGFANTDFVIMPLETERAVEIDPAVQLDRYERALKDVGHRNIRAAATSAFPLIGTWRGTVLGPPQAHRREWNTLVLIRIVTPAYFAITGMTPSAGRMLTPSDTGMRRAVVNDAFVRAILPQQDPIGFRPIEWSRWGIWASELTVVGVTPGIRQSDFNERIRPELYVLYDDYVGLLRDDNIAAHTNVSATMRTRAAGDALRRLYVVAEPSHGISTTLSILRDTLAAAVPEAQLHEPSYMRDVINDRLGVKRLVGAASTTFAVIALLLAGVGLYGMIGHQVARRTREIGVRMALGASPGRIAFEWIRPVAIVYGCGVVLGVLLLSWGSAAIRAVLVPPAGVEYPSLGGVVVIVASVLIATVALACYRPIRIATHADPAVSLRQE